MHSSHPRSGWSGQLSSGCRRDRSLATRDHGARQAAGGIRLHPRLSRPARPPQGRLPRDGVCRRALWLERLRRRRATHAGDGKTSGRARVPSHRRRRLLHPQSRGARSRGRPGNPPRFARPELTNEHAHDDRAVDPVRKAGIHSHRARLMATLKGKALIAYLVVCVFWGSTYLAIKVGVTDLPPFLFAGLRFLVAGLLLLAGGNAFVVWSEQYIGSGIASIFVVTVAMWTALFDVIIPGGASELNWRIIAGLLLGFLGTLLLVGATPAEILAADKRGPIALTLASASWSVGTVYAKRHPTQASPYMGAAFQMIVGGVTVALVGTVLGEWASWHLSPRGIGAIAYLVVFGSILGYSAYSYALRHAS